MSYWRRLRNLSQNVEFSLDCHNACSLKCCRIEIEGHGGLASLAHRPERLLDKTFLLQRPISHLSPELIDFGVEADLLEADLLIMLSCHLLESLINLFLSPLHHLLHGLTYLLLELLHQGLIIIRSDSIITLLSDFSQRNHLNFNCFLVLHFLFVLYVDCVIVQFNSNSKSTDSVRIQMIFSNFGFSIWLSSSFPNYFLINQNNAISIINSHDRTIHEFYNSDELYLQYLDVNQNLEEFAKCL